MPRMTREALRENRKEIIHINSRIHLLELGLQEEITRLLLEDQQMHFETLQETNLKLQIIHIKEW